MSLVWYIAVMAVVTYLIRMLPFTLLRRQIRSRFVRSLLYYLTYAVIRELLEGHPEIRSRRSSARLSHWCWRIGGYRSS